MAVKPFEISIQGDKCRATSPEGDVAEITIAELIERARPHAVDTAGTVVPAGFRMAYSLGQFTIWVHETPPRVHQLKWIASSSGPAYGHGAKYKNVKIACPYVVILAVFQNHHMGGFSECFFRTSPLASEHDELCYPALLNCSKFPKELDRQPLSWICTQKLDTAMYSSIRDPAKRMRMGLKALFQCLWDTGFNRSSENHEGSSWFTETGKVLPEISTVENWEKATAKDPLFALDLKWIPTGRSVKQMVERTFARIGAVERRVETANNLASLVFRPMK